MPGPTSWRQQQAISADWKGHQGGKVENVLRVGRGITYICILHSGLLRLCTEHFFGCQSEPKNVLQVDRAFQAMCMYSTLSWP